MQLKDKKGFGEITITRLSKSSWFKFEIDNKIIHFDPGYTGYFKNQGIPLDELEEKADIIFISHYHKDHIQQEALEKIVKDGTIIIAPIICRDKIDFNNIKFVKSGDTINFENFTIKVVDAYNTKEGHSTRKVHHKGDFVGFLIDLNDKLVYFAGDTDLIPEMKVLGKVDIAFIPIGGTFVMTLMKLLKQSL